MTREEWRQQVSRHDDALWSLFQIYFNEDWADLYGRPWTNVVDEFITDNFPEAVQATLAELQKLLSDGLSEADLKWLLHDVLGIAFNWEAPGIGFSSAGEFLETLRDEVRRRLPQQV